MPVIIRPDTGGVVITSLVYLRAVAILLVIGVHAISYGSMTWEQWAWWHRLWTDSTVFFVIISGYLFHHLVSDRRTISRFLGQKLRHVFLPYCVLSLLILVCGGLRNHESPVRVLQDYPLHLLRGDALLPYWFIPAQLGMTAISVVLWYARQYAKVLVVLPFLILLTVLVPRPVDSIGWSLLHFLPFYLLGIALSKYRQRSLAWLGRWRNLAWLAVAAVCLYSLSLRYYGVNSLQKGVVFLLLYGWLERRQTAGWLESLPGCWMKWLADASIGLFFLHYLFMEGLGWWLARHPVMLNPYAMHALGMAFSLGGSMLAVTLVRLLLPHHSKFLIGC